MTKSLRILIGEDDGILAMDLAELLISMGHDVCAIAATEAEAVAKAEQFKPDLVIMDGKLRGSSGVTAMQRILESSIVAHFYVTANPWEVRELAPDAIIVTKPFTLRELNLGIANACAAGLHRQNTQ